MPSEAKIKRNNYMNEYYKRPGVAEKIKARVIKYNVENKDKIKEYLEKNKEAIKVKQKIRNKRFYLKNKEKILVDTKEYRKNWKSRRNELYALRIQTDSSFVIQKRLRNRLRKAFVAFTNSNKCKTSDEYGINYNAIMEKLGPCPGDRKDFHIDHIVPLSSFDFNDADQVKQAFTPENHQWLTAEENLQKNAF